MDAIALDSSVGDTLKRSQADYSELVTAQDKPGTIADMPVLENGCENHRIAGVTSTSVVSSRVCYINLAGKVKLDLKHDPYASIY